jgi:hypothetical protein
LRRKKSTTMKIVKMVGIMLLGVVFATKVKDLIGTYAPGVRDAMDKIG